VTAGEGTSFFHQWHELTKLGHRHPNPRRQVLNDIKTIALQAISKGTNMCTSIDANEALDTNNQLFHKWIAECGLVSVHENLYNEEYYNNNPIPATYQHGRKKIDHVSCTPRLFGCFTGVAIKPLHDRLFSDHRALIVDFDTAQLLGQTLHIVKSKTRLLTATRKKGCNSTISNSTTNYKPKTYIREQSNYRHSTKWTKNQHHEWTTRLKSSMSTSPPACSWQR
jgi:hypothetical protein